jgi:hypothetical protein
MKILYFLAISLLAPVVLSAQVKNEDLPALLETKQFVFKANTAIPFADADLYQALRMLGNPGGGTIPLNTSVYDLQVKSDSVLAYLPYFGRAFMGVAEREDLSIKFNSKKFNYQLDKRKKGGWRIKIITQDLNRNFTLFLEITESGYATLNVRDQVRQAISYYGYIDKLDE